jgi:hypothetical protein
MDYFESIIKKLLEEEGYWVRQSFKVNLTKEEKRSIGKPSIPRPEIDLLAHQPSSGVVLAIEAKSYLDSPGVRFNELDIEHDIPEGRYKLFTSTKYRDVVFDRLKKDLIEAGMIDDDVLIQLGLVAGNIYQNRSTDIRKLLLSKSMFFWSPEDIKRKLSTFAELKYENDPVIITAKILLR